MVNVAKVSPLRILPHRGYNVPHEYRISFLCYTREKLHCLETPAPEPTTTVTSQTLSASDFVIDPTINNA